MRRLVLASASPRRRELLAQAGFSFEVHPAHIPEDPLPNEDPIAYVVRLASRKSRSRICTTLRHATILRWRSHPPGARRRYHSHARQSHSGKARRRSRRRAHVAHAIRSHSPRHHRGCRCHIKWHRSCRGSYRRPVFEPCPTRKSLHTLPPANPWTKPAPTRFKAAPPAGSRAFKAATSTSSACRSRSSPRFSNQ